MDLKYLLTISRMKEQHLLNDEWSWWEHRKASSEQDYSNNTVRCIDFNTVEQFWQCMNHIPSPSEFFTMDAIIVPFRTRMVRKDM